MMVVILVARLRTLHYSWAGRSIHWCATAARRNSSDEALIMSSFMTVPRWFAALALVALAALPASADDWPQWQGPKRDGVWREAGILAKFPKDGPKVLWRSPIGSGFSGPAVASGRIYVMDRQGEMVAKGKEAPPK